MIPPEWKALPRQFFEPSAKMVAPRLLGHWLIRRTPQGFSGGPIVETEAYLANDPGSHAFVGMTNRNRIMFGRPGHAYVYLIYGFYHCFNTV
jgi:DNA-3-methyladenine glycosylase